MSIMAGRSWFDRLTMSGRLLLIYARFNSDPKKMYPSSTFILAGIKKEDTTPIPENTEETWRNSRDDLFRRYREVIAESDDLPEHTLQWSSVSRAFVRLNELDLLVIESTSYSFEGGAHGVHGSDYGIFDLRTGARPLAERHRRGSPRRSSGPVRDRHHRYGCYDRISAPDRLAWRPVLSRLGGPQGTRQIIVVNRSGRPDPGAGRRIELRGRLEEIDLGGRPGTRDSCRGHVLYMESWRPAN